MSDFVKRDSARTQAAIEELRNKVAGKLNKWSNTIQVSMASSTKVERSEGEVWEEDGKRWEMKDGIKRSITALSGARMPFWCPKCSIPMNHRFDRKFYFLRGWCYNCNIDIEGQMRIDGTFEAFEKRIMRENEKAFLHDKLVEYKEYIENFTPPTMVYDDGRYEQLAPRAVFEPLFEDILKDADLLIARLEVIAKEEQDELEADANRETTDSIPAKTSDISDNGDGGIDNVSNREGSGTID